MPGELVSTGLTKEKDESLPLLEDGVETKVKGEPLVDRSEIMFIVAVDVNGSEVDVAAVEDVIAELDIVLAVVEVDDIENGFDETVLENCDGIDRDDECGNPFVVVDVLLGISKTKSPSLIRKVTRCNIFILDEAGTNPEPVSLDGLVIGIDKVGFITVVPPTVVLDCLILEFNVVLSNPESIG